MDPTVPAGPAPAGSAYPVTYEVDDPGPIDRWRPFVQWFLAIPHLVVLYVLGIVSNVLAFVSWFAILFTGKLPEALAGWQFLYLRYTNRTYAYADFLREEYPPFTFEMLADDPGDYPGVQTEVAPEYEDRNRLTVAFRFILVIPHVVCLLFLGLAAWVAMIIGAFAILFTGSWPEGLRTFVVGVWRWSTRVNGYHLLLVDEYPPFSLE